MNYPSYYNNFVFLYTFLLRVYFVPEAGIPVFSKNTNKRILFFSDAYGYIFIIHTMNTLNTYNLGCMQSMSL